MAKLKLTNVQVLFDRSNVTNASSRAGDSSAVTSAGQSKRGLLYPVEKIKKTPFFHFKIS